MGIFRRKHNAPAPRVADQIMTYAEPVKNQDGTISFKLRNDDQNQMAIVPQLHAISQNASLPERLFKARQAKRIMWEIQQKAKNMKNSDINYSNPKVKVEPKKQEEGSEEKLTPMKSKGLNTTQIPDKVQLPLGYDQPQPVFSPESMGTYSPNEAIPGIMTDIYDKAILEGRAPKEGDSWISNWWYGTTDPNTARFNNEAEYATDEYWRQRLDYYYKQAKNEGKSDWEAINDAEHKAYTEKAGGDPNQDANWLGRNAAIEYQLATNPINRKGFDIPDIIDLVHGIKLAPNPYDAYRYVRAGDYGRALNAINPGASIYNSMDDPDFRRGWAGIQSLFGYGPEAEKDNE